MANTLNLGTDGNWATKEDSLLAYNSENGNFKPLPFDFTRASSATRVNKAGLIETVGSGKPRIDYKDDSKGALKLEPTRSNLLTYSEDFSQSYWSKVRVSILSNQTISPNGTLTADLLTVTDTAENYVQTNAPITVSGTKQTVSCFVKKGTNDFAHILLWDTSSNGSRQWFDVSNGTIGSSTIFGSGISVDSASIENYGNGWFRCIVVFNCSFTSVRTRVSASNGDGQTNGTIGKTIFIWGFQAESNSTYATSYIPTQGQSGGVTRVADNAYQQGVTQVIGQSEGTMFIEFIPKDSSALQILYQAKSSSGVVGQIDIRLQSGLIRALANDGGGSQFFINGGSYAVGTKYKVAIRYKLNDSKLYINGTDSGSDTSCSFTGSSLDQVSFADSLSSFLPSVDIIDSRLYNTALTDSELAALTKI